MTKISKQCRWGILFWMLLLGDSIGMKHSNENNSNHESEKSTSFSRSTSTFEDLMMDRSNGVGLVEPIRIMEDENKELDCGMRQLFWEQAQKIIPWRQNQQDIWDALELTTRCNSTINSSNTNGNDVLLMNQIKRTRSDRRKLQRRNVTYHYYYVCPTHGRDYDNEFVGNETHPFHTVHRALQASRDNRASINANTPTRMTTQKQRDHHQHHVIVLREGIHFLKTPIILKPKDSDLTIRSTPNETAWISGGTLLRSRLAGWRPMLRHPHIWIAHNVSSLYKDNDRTITGLFTINPHKRLTLARYPNANVEDWNAENRYDNIDDNANDEWLFPPYNRVPQFVYYNLTDPNNPTGYIKSDSAMSDYNLYGTGQGGACSSVWRDDVPSYWCSNISAGGWAFVDKAAALAGRMNIPIGLRLKDHSNFQQRIIQQWKHNPKGAIFHVSHTQGWAWHMFNVSKIETITTTTNKRHSNKTRSFHHSTTTAAAATTTTTIYFDKGGWQGGRNWQCKDKSGSLSDCNGDDKKLHSGPWYVEGILDELDYPGEFYWDAESKKLYLYPDCERKDESNNNNNKSNNDTSDKQRKLCFPPDLIATNLKTLIRMEGAQENPVRNINLQEVGFRDAAKTYMDEQWTAPSGGDWALHRGGAVHLEGTEHVTISDCQFLRLDGNAIMLGGYNRNTTVAQSEFAWLGEGAMATWGDTDGYDATNESQPRFSVIEHNVMSNLGLYEKQSSAWGQNKACLNTIRYNVMFNLPRAAINFNDGLGGGNLVEGNVIFNACRESGDHGPINSWDRMPFLTNTTGTPSFTPLPTHSQHNIILANYGASEGFDNDDGSSWYYTHDNVFYQADGFKMDYGGHSSRFYNNLVYSDSKSCYGTGSFLKGQEDVFANNTCIIATTKKDSPSLGHMFQCSLDGMNPTSNRYYSNTGNGTFICDSEDLTLARMQQKGFEVGSTLKKVPTADTILSWARAILARCIP